MQVVIRLKSNQIWQKAFFLLRFLGSLGTKFLYAFYAFYGSFRHENITEPKQNFHVYWLAVGCHGKKYEGSQKKIICNILYSSSILFKMKTEAQDPYFPFFRNADQTVYQLSVLRPILYSFWSEISDFKKKHSAFPRIHLFMMYWATGLFFQPLKLISHLIIYIQKFLDPDWLRVMQFLGNTMQK